jgi:hypothetical protein
MKPPLRRGNQYSAALLDLLACMAGFGAATGAARRGWVRRGSRPGRFNGLFRPPLPGWRSLFPESSLRDGMPRWVDGFFTATGANLLVQYGLAYLFGIPAAPWFVIVLGSALSLAAAGPLRKAILAAPGGRRNGILLVGYDSSTASLAAASEETVLGLLASGPPPDAGELPFLGSPDRLDEVCETKHPRAVVMSGRPAGIGLAHLLRLHYAGTEVESAPFLCESVLRRVAWQQLSPSDLLFSVTPVTGRAMLAFQAIYKNLVGLGLLIVFAPVLILAALLIPIFTGGAALEHIECGPSAHSFSDVSLSDRPAGRRTFLDRESDCAPASDQPAAVAQRVPRRNDTVRPTAGAHGFCRPACSNSCRPTCIASR